MPMLQYILYKGMIDGLEYGGNDFIFYDFGHSVYPHVDTEGVHVPDMPSFGRYAVAKLDRESTPSMFCNCSEGGGTGANCCWKDHDPQHVNYGGHKQLCPLCIYFMIRKGAFGGPYHSLHGKERKGARDLWCGFDSQHITMVLRPFL